MSSPERLGRLSVMGSRTDARNEQLEGEAQAAAANETSSPSFGQQNVPAPRSEAAGRTAPAVVKGGGDCGAAGVRKGQVMVRPRSTRRGDANTAEDDEQHGEPCKGESDTESVISSAGSNASRGSF